MTLAKIKINGWSKNERLTSAQITQIDADRDKTLDKTGDNLTNGGGIAGRIDVKAGASIRAQSGGALVLENGSAMNINSAFVGINGASEIDVTGTSAIISKVSAGIQSTSANGITTGTASGIKSTIAGGITTDTAGGISTTVAGGIAAGITSAIKSNIASGITSSVAGGISSGVDGGLKCSNGVTDWLGLSTRTIGRSVLAADQLIPGAAEFASGGTALPMPAIVINSPSGANAFFKVSNVMPNNATLQTITFHFLPYATYSAAPTTFPSFNVYRYPSDFSGSFSLSSGGAVTYPTESNGTWTNGSIKTFTFTCDQYNVIDKYNSTYSILFNDGSGGSGTRGMILLKIVYTYSLSDLQAF